MANSPIVSSLPDYVDQNREPLIARSLLGARTAKLFSLQSGIKSSAALNLIAESVEFQDGSSCGWSEAGTATLSQRILQTGLFKVNQAYCDKALIGKWAEYQVRIAAGQKSLPFEEDFMNILVDEINEELETELWWGNSDITNLLGLIPDILGASDSGVISATATVSELADYFSAVQTTLLAIPARAIKSDTVIMCSPAFLRNYGQALVVGNYYHFEPNKDYEDIIIPGSRVKLVAVPGLEVPTDSTTTYGDYVLVAGRLSNFFYGCDMQGDEEKFDLWYSKDNGEFRVAVEFNAGTQVGYPDEVVLASVTTGSSTESNE